MFLHEARCVLAARRFAFDRKVWMCFTGEPGQTHLPDGGRDSGTIRQKLWKRVRPSLPPQLQQGRRAVEVVEKPAGKRRE